MIQGHYAPILGWQISFSSFQNFSYDAISTSFDLCLATMQVEVTTWWSPNSRSLQLVLNFVPWLLLQLIMQPKSSPQWLPFPSWQLKWWNPFPVHVSQSYMAVHLHTEFYVKCALTFVLENIVDLSYGWLGYKHPLLLLLRVIPVITHISLYEIAAVPHCIWI